MANKEALRELQQRLAQRMQSAQSQQDSAAWLAVRLGARNYLLSLAHSGEIFSFGGVTRVPYTQPWFAGVVSLRGGLYGVVDLLRLLEPDAPARAEASMSQARLVTMNVDLGMNCALIVDALLGLRRQDSFSSHSSAAQGAPSCYGLSFVDESGAQWQEIDLVQLSRDDAFLEIGEKQFQ